MVVGVLGDILAEDCRIKLDLHFGKSGRLLHATISFRTCVRPWEIKLACCFHPCDSGDPLRAQPREELGAITGTHSHVAST